MDQKTWLWRKRPSEKTIVTNGEEEQSPPSPTEKEIHLETSLKALNEKLASVLDECSAKDKLVQNYEKVADDAIADKQKAEEQIQSLKQELDEVQKQKVAANERLGHLNSALKDCMEQLNQLRLEQDQRLHDAVMKTSIEFEKSHKKLEEKLSETSKRLADLTVESSYLAKALLVKEKLIEDLNKCKSQTEAEFEALMTRLDSIEKENAFLRYEFQSLEKELDLRNEELEYNRRSAESSNKKHLENIKKIKKLESECQRLRALTRKRLPSPSILANFKSDFEIHGRDYGTDDSRRKKGVIGGPVVRDLRIHVEDLEKENNILRECLAKKEEEVYYLRKFENSSRFDLALSNPQPDEISFTSGYEIVESNALTRGKDTDKFSDSRNAEECRTIGALEMSLMDDFVEMEKLAIVAVDASEMSHTSLDSSKGMIVPWEQNELREKKEVKTKDSSQWLREVKNLIMEQKKLSKRSLSEILEDIKMALDGNLSPKQSQLLPISGYLTWKSPASPSSSFSHDYMAEASNEDMSSTIRDEFRKHLGGDGPGTAMELESVRNLMFEIEKIYSVLQVELAGLKNELNVKSLEYEALMDKLQQSEKRISSLQEEVGILMESKRMVEDQVDNQKMINEDLDTHLSVSKAKLNEVMQKLASVEVELDNKRHCCEELEGTCLELQLQLESNTNHRHSDENENPEELLKTGMEITKASAKLAECEKTILNLGNQLKALGSTKELSVVDKVLSITSTNNKKFKHQRSSLRDHIISEDSGEAENLQSPKTKEIISMNKTNAPSMFQAGNCNAFSFPDGQMTTPNAYQGMKIESKNVNSGALIIFPNKKRGGIGFLKKLLIRRKKATSLYFGK